LLEPSVLLLPETAHQDTGTVELGLTLISLQDQIVLLEVLVLELFLQLLFLLDDLLELVLFFSKLGKDDIKLGLCSSQGLALGPDLLGYEIILADCDDPLTDTLCGLRGLADLIWDEFGI